MPKKKTGSLVKTLNEKVAMLASELARVTNDVKGLAKQGRAHYEALDDNTKRNAKIAFSALAALLTMKVVKSAAKSKKKKK